MTYFLGLQIERETKTGNITLSQSGLIDRILEAMGMVDSNLKFIPTEKVPLNKDLKGYPCCETLSYGSIIGMLLYLSRSTRLDIAYTIHQFAQFFHDPKYSHEVGLKYIAHHLKHNRTKELILKPNAKKF